MFYIFVCLKLKPKKKKFVITYLRNLCKAREALDCTRPAWEFHFFEIRYHFVMKVLVQSSEKRQRKK